MRGARSRLKQTAPRIPEIAATTDELCNLSIAESARRGWVVLASDASHMYDNFETDAPYPLVHNAQTMLGGFRRLKNLGDSLGHIIPGHDPLVMDRYPAAKPETEGIVARLDMDPRS